MDTHQVKSVTCDNTMTPTQRHREMEMRGKRCGQGGDSAGAKCITCKTPKHGGIYRRKTACTYVCTQTYMCVTPWETDSLEKTLMLGKIEGRRRRGGQRMRWLDGVTDSVDLTEQAPGVGDGQGSLACCSPWGHTESDTTDRLS